MSQSIFYIYNKGLKGKHRSSGSRPFYNRGPYCDNMDRKLKVIAEYHKTLVEKYAANASRWCIASTLTTDAFTSVQCRPIADYKTWKNWRIQESFRSQDRRFSQTLQRLPLCNFGEKWKVLSIAFGKHSRYSKSLSCFLSYSDQSLTGSFENAGEDHLHRIVL